MSRGEILRSTAFTYARAFSEDWRMREPAGPRALGSYANAFAGLKACVLAPGEIDGMHWMHVEDYTDFVQEYTKEYIRPWP